MTTSGDSLQVWLQALFLLGISVTTVHASQFLHIGCYAITSETSGLRFNYGSLALEICAQGCNKEGYPFITLRNGHDCVCVTSYGQNGEAQYGAQCNYTCKTDEFNFLCGGVIFEDVYYSVDTDSSILSQRDDVLIDEPNTFENARMSCVKQNGDLPLLVNQKQIDVMMSVVATSNYSGVWTSAYRSPWGDGKFAWAGIKLPKPEDVIDLSDTSMHWSADNVYHGNGDCVILLKDEKKLKAVECDASYPHICFQIPPPETTTDDRMTTPPLATTAAPETDFWLNNRWTIFWILLPIFIILFFGSCLIYVTYHIWLLCNAMYRRRAYNRDLNSDRRPLTEVDEDGRPLTVRDVEIQNRAYSMTPVQEMKIEREGMFMTPPPAPVMTSDVNIKAQSEQMRTLSDTDPDIDFTKLSINDIMYIKMIVGGNDPKNKKMQGKKKKALAST